MVDGWRQGRGLGWWWWCWLGFGESGSRVLTVDSSMQCSIELFDGSRDRLVHLWLIYWTRQSELVASDTTRLLKMSVINIFSIHNAKEMHTGIDVLYIHVYTHAWVTASCAICVYESLVGLSSANNPPKVERNTISVSAQANVRAHVNHVLSGACTDVTEKLFSPPNLALECMQISGTGSLLDWLTCMFAWAGSTYVGWFPPCLGLAIEYGLTKLLCKSRL